MLGKQLFKKNDISIFYFDFFFFLDNKNNLTFFGLFFSGGNKLE